MSISLDIIGERRYWETNTHFKTIWGKIQIFPWFFPVCKAPCICRELCIYEIYTDFSGNFTGTVLLYEPILPGQLATILLTIDSVSMSSCCIIRGWECEKLRSRIPYMKMLSKWAFLAIETRPECCTRFRFLTLILLSPWHGQWQYYYARYRLIYSGNFNSGSLISSPLIVKCIVFVVGQAAWEGLD